MNLLAILELPYGFGPTFDPMFQELAKVRTDVYSTLTLFVYVLAFAGLLICAYRQQTGGDLGQMGNQLMMTAVVAVALHFIPDWILDAENSVGWKMLEDMNIDLEDITNKWIGEVVEYITEQLLIIVGELAAAGLLGFFDIVAGIVAIIYALIGLIMVAIVGLVAIFIWVVLLAAYLIEGASVELGIATAPIFLGMFLFPTTKETAIRYFTGLTAILFWPLGWGMGYKILGLITDVLNTVLNTCAPLVALNVLFAGIIDGVIYIMEGMLFWAVIKKAPPLVAKAFTTGTQIGAGLVSAGVSSAASTISSSVSAAGSVASTAVSMAGSVGGAAIGAAAGGGAGAGIGASVGGAVGGAAGSAISGGAGAAAAGIKGAGEGLAGMSEGA